jgi:Initiation factor 2 subunit family
VADLVIVGTDQVTAMSATRDLSEGARRPRQRRAVLCRLAIADDRFLIRDGAQIPIEQRDADEVSTMTGRTAEGRIETIWIVAEGSPVANYGFDVTPARLVTGLITERGVLKPEREALAGAFPEQAGERWGDQRDFRGHWEASRGWAFLMIARHSLNSPGRNPEYPRYRKGIDRPSLPPGDFVTVTVDVTVMNSAEWRCEFVTYLQSHRPRLSEP